MSETPHSPGENVELLVEKKQLLEDIHTTLTQIPFTEGSAIFTIVDELPAIRGGDSTWPYYRDLKVPIHVGIHRQGEESDPVFVLHVDSEVGCAAMRCVVGKALDFEGTKRPATNRLQVVHSNPLEAEVALYRFIDGLTTHFVNHRPGYSPPSPRGGLYIVE